jgi:hypothetical protein
MMANEPSFCVVCAWRENCQKKFLKGKDTTLRCTDFTKDLSIKNTETPDDKKTGSGDNT